MKKKIILLCLFMVLVLSSCSVNKNNHETENIGDTEEVVQDPDLVLLEQESTVEICNGEIVAQIQEPYSGVFWENENHEEVSAVYYVKFTNCTDHMIETADIILGDAEGELLFHIDMLRAGESAYVAERDKKPAKDYNLRYIDSDIKYIEEDSIISDLVKIEVENGNELKIHNTTGDFLPLIHIYYALLMDGTARISGTAFSVSIDGMEANGEEIIPVVGWDKDYQIICVTKTRE